MKTSLQRQNRQYSVNPRTSRISSFGLSLISFSNSLKNGFFSTVILSVVRDVSMPSIIITICVSPVVWNIGYVHSISYFDCTSQLLLVSDALNIGLLTEFKCVPFTVNGLPPLKHEETTVIHVHIHVHSSSYKSRVFIKNCVAENLNYRLNIAVVAGSMTRRLLPEDMTTSVSVDSNHFGNTPFESLLSNDKNTSVNMKALFKTQTALSSKRLKE